MYNPKKKEVLFTNELTHHVARARGDFSSASREQHHDPCRCRVLLDQRIDNVRFNIIHQPTHAQFGSVRILRSDALTLKVPLTKITRLKRDFDDTSILQSKDTPPPRETPKKYTSTQLSFQWFICLLICMWAIHADVDVQQEDGRYGSVKPTI